MENNTVSVNEKVYTFRTLAAPDTFLMFKILGKIGVNRFAECFTRDSVKQLLAQITKEGGSEENINSIVGVSVMLEIADVIISNIPSCEAEIYQMLSNTSNLSVEEVRDLDFVTFAEMVMDFIKKEEFKDFITVASKLFKRTN